MDPHDLAQQWVKQTVVTYVMLGLFDGIPDKQLQQRLAADVEILIRNVLAETKAARPAPKAKKAKAS